MEQMSFGEILRQTRERKGLDFTATARRLRIRPDILQAIEDSNFAAMPPRGYSRNMVNGYARYLGLNATDITGRYLDELYTYQVGSARVNARKGTYGKSTNLRGGKTESNRPVRSRETAAPGRSRRREIADSIPDPSQRTTSSRRQNQPPRGSSAPDMKYTSLYSAPVNKNGWRSRLPFIGAAVIILLVIIIVSLLLFGGNKNAETVEAVPNLPVTGASDATGQGGDGTAPQPVVEQIVAPTKFTFTYNVAAGAETYIEVYVDDQIKVAKDMTGPATESFDCSGTLKFICSGVTGVTATQDNKPITLEPGSSGIVNITIKFDDVLKAWQEEHGSTTTGTSATQQASGNTAGSSSTQANATTSSSTSSSSSSSSSDEENYDESYDEDYSYSTQSSYQEDDSDE